MSLITIRFNESKGNEGIAVRIWGSHVVLVLAFQSFPKNMHVNDWGRRKLLDVGK